MLCKIADLLVEVPAAGNLNARCGEYAFKENNNVSADIIICADEYKLSSWKDLSYEQAVYMASGTQFYVKLLKFNGLMLHASAVELDGKAYLFSGPSGMGKSTHTRLWQELFGEKARVFNDDKPALRYVDGIWYAYGTPWCGKDGINVNMKVPIAGICFLKRGEKNEIRRLSKIEAAAAIFTQTTSRFAKPESLDVLLGIMDRVIDSVPIYELKCTPEPEAARLSYEVMSKGGQVI